MKSITLSLFITVINIYTTLNSGIIEVDFYKKKSDNPFSKSHNFFISKMRSFQDSFPLINYPNDQMILNLCLGTPPQCFNVVVDSGSHYLWIRDINNHSYTANKFNSKNSSTFVNLKIPMKINYGTGSAEGEAATEVLNLGDNKLDKLNFLLVEKDKSNNGIDGILGLGYYYNNLSQQNSLEFSLIDQLYNNNQINSKIFTQKYIHDRKGKMYIGDLPDEIKNDMSNYGTCPTIKYINNGMLNPRWECELKSFYFGDHTSYSKYEEYISPVLFDTGTNIVLVPVEFFIRLRLFYFNELIESDQCQLKQDDNKFMSYTCSPLAKIDTLPDINFSFGESHITMRTEELFARSPLGFFQFIMFANPKTNMWIFGEPILKKYHIVFDKTNDVIGFYETKYFNKYNYISPLLILTSIVVVGLRYYIFWLRKKREKNQNYNTPNTNFDLLRNSDM
jgi:hypothetical protein